MARPNEETFEKFSNRKARIRTKNGKSSCNRLRKAKPRYCDDF